MAFQVAAASIVPSMSARIALLATLFCLQCQGLAIWMKPDAQFNLIQLLNLYAKDIPEMQSWLICKDSKWVSHDILNVFTEIMSRDVLRMLIK